MLLYTILLSILFYLLITHYNNGKSNNTINNFNYLLNPKCGVLNRPDFINDNFSKRFRDELDNTLEKLSNKNNYKKIRPVSSCQYITSTIPLETKLELNKIINSILNDINNIFNFNLVEIKNVEVFIDNSNNKQYICDILVNDNKNYLSVRLKLDIVIKYKSSKRNTSPTCTDITNPPFKKYKIGIPSEDQLIPLPTDVIVTERTILSKNTINEIKPDEIKNIHINYVTILNCDDVINGYHIDEKKDNLGGVNDGKNEFSNLQTPDNNPYIEPAVVRNKWITLNQQPTGYKAFPCQEPPNTWNILGVPSEDIKYTAECPGKRESTEQTDLQGQTWPTLGTVPRKIGDNAWLFKLDRGIPSFPTGRST